MPTVKEIMEQKRRESESQKKVITPPVQAKASEPVRPQPVPESEPVIEDKWQSENKEKVEQEEVTEAQHKRYESGKMSHLERMQYLSKTRKKVAFIAHTPTTRSGRKAHAVQLRDFIVEKTKDNNFTVCGRDLEEEEKIQAERMEEGKKRKCYSDRPKKQMAFRKFRIDRIMSGTIF